MPTKLGGKNWREEISETKIEMGRYYSNGL
jgi:hypothetical protein